MAVRNAEASWQGNLKDGKGIMKFGSGAFEGPYSFSSRFKEGEGTNPEELIGAAHAGCFSMALSADLGKTGYFPKQIQTQAEVHLGQVEGKSRITKIYLRSQAEVPYIDENEFLRIAESTKSSCPVSAALTGVEIVLNAQLIS